MSLTAGGIAAVSAMTGGWLVYTSATGADRRSRGRRTAERPRRLGQSVGAALGERLGPSNRRGGRSGSAGREVAAAVAVAVAGGALLAWLLFGGLAPAVLCGVFAGTFPVAAHRRRAQMRLESAIAEWPRVLEEIRLRTGSLGRSVPQAVFEAARKVPDEWRPTFDAAEREWLLTVDFGATVSILKEGLDDPTADAVFETLLMAHEVGGTDLDTKLVDLIEDRTLDLQSRLDADSRLAGVRFARRFVLLVPLGMALAGLTIGSGRQAYETIGGQIAVAAGLVAVALCWWWSGRLMRLPVPPRVFG